MREQNKTVRMDRYVKRVLKACMIYGDYHDYDMDRVKLLKQQRRNRIEFSQNRRQNAK